MTDWNQRLRNSRSTRYSGSDDEGDETRAPDHARPPADQGAPPGPLKPVVDPANATMNALMRASLRENKSTKETKR